MAVIGNHNGDSLANVYSNARNTYNGVTAYPTTKFDGILQHIGGGSSSLYALFLTKVNQRNAVLSDFSIDLQFEHLTGNDYHATVTIEKVAPYSGTNLVLQLVVTESNLDINWGLGDDVNGVNRLMVPNQNGTPVSFASGDVQTVELDFTMQSYWAEENCELIAFLQDNSSKEILQADLKTMAVAEFGLDAELADVLNIPAKLCHGTLEPVVKIKNKGAEVLTSVNINFKANGELVYTYPWTGELEFPLMETVDIPEFNFQALTENEIEVYLTDPNNGVDQNPDNNSITKMLEATTVCTDYMSLLLKTDANPQQTSWECFAPNGELVGSGGPYTQSFQYIKDTMFFEMPGCYQFFIYDAAGDGLTTYYSLRSIVDGVVTTVFSGGSFGYVEETQFTAEADGVMAAFTSDVQAGCNELTVQYSDNSLGAVSGWTWEFEGGDPTTSTEQNPTVYYGLPGVYDVTLTVTDGTNSNTYENQNYITVFELPAVEFSALENQCIDWPGFELSEGTPEGGVYSGPGVDNGWFYPETAGMGTHTLTYTYVDGNGCENAAQQDILVDACTGIGNLTGTQSLKVYPNPVTSVSTIEYQVATDRDVNISIYNSLGMLVREITPQNNTGRCKVDVSISEFENGIYFVRLTAGDLSTTTKMTIVK